MIHYDLRCRSGHAFDGWFPGSAAFERQAAAGLVACPACGATSVERALMTPSVRTARAERISPPTPTADRVPSTARPPVPLPPMPDAVRAFLQRMRAEVEKHCDYVGPDFAKEARRIHDGEAAARGIYGEATPDEAADLAADGIEVGSIPWVPLPDA